MSTDSPDGSDTAEDEGILSPLIGHAGAKAIIRSALRRGDVDIHLSGPPASGKSVVLLAAEDHIDGAEYVEARGLSERKLRDILKEDPPVLLIDEFDNMDRDAYKALNTAMEQGRVTKNVHNDAYDVEIDTQVIAASNDLDAIPGDVADRFVPVPFEPYTREEFIKVCGKLLPEQVDWVGETSEPEAIGRDIAATVWDETNTRSPRKARDAARLASSVQRVGPIVQAMSDPKADVDSDPLHPDDLPHEQSSGGSSSQDTKTLDDIRESMADPSEIEEKSVEEVVDIIGTEPGEDTEDDDTDTTESQSTDSGGSSGGGAAGISGEEFVERMVEEEGRLIPNDYGKPIVELVVPDSISEETEELVNNFDMDPASPNIFPQSPSFAEQYPDATEDLTSFQFLLDDNEALGTSGYDVENILDGMEGEPFLVTKASGVEASVPV